MWNFKVLLLTKYLSDDQIKKKMRIQQRSGGPGLQSTCSYLRGALRYTKTIRTKALELALLLNSPVQGCHRNIHIHCAQAEVSGRMEECRVKTYGIYVPPIISF
jgi:hypothetical protein